jgi:hypothetical protein
VCGLEAGMSERRVPKPATLDERIAAALGNGVEIASDDLSQLTQAIENAIRQSHNVSEQERARSLDPLTPTSDAELCGQRADACVLRCQRLATALVRLRTMLAEQLHAERCAAWNEQADRVDKLTADAATKLGRYPELAQQIVAILNAVEQANQAVGEINGRAPDGVMRRLATVELTHLQKLTLPDPANPDRKLWPREVQLGAIYAASMVPRSDPRLTSGRWWEIKAEQQEREREQQRRQAENYQRMTVEQEERQNREERERFARSQRRS